MRDISMLGQTDISPKMSPNLELRIETGKISFEGWRGGKKYEHTFQLELVVKIITFIHLCTPQQCRLTQQQNYCRWRTGDSRNKTRLAKVVVVANSKQKCSVRTHNVVKYTSKNFAYDYTLYWVEEAAGKCVK